MKYAADPLDIHAEISPTQIDERPHPRVDRTPAAKTNGSAFKSGTKLKVLASSFQEWGDYSNPVPYVLYKAMADLNVEVKGFRVRHLIFGTWDIWHLHWPAEHVQLDQRKLLAIFRLVAFWVKVKIAKVKSVKIFWTVHNLSPHEIRHPALHKVFRRMFLPNVDGLILMSSSAEEIVRCEYLLAKACQTFIIPHGHYRGLYPDSIDRMAARERLGLANSDFVILFFGLIRAYKNVTNLIRCFRAASIPGSCLVIAGKPWDNDIVVRTLEATAGDPNIRLHLKSISQEFVQYYLRAADLIALPYTKILNSGAALLALSFDRPVLLPALGAMPELCEMVGEHWVRLYEGDLTPEILRSAIQWTQQRERNKSDRPTLNSLDWTRLAKLTIEAFRKRVTVYNENTQARS